MKVSDEGRKLWRRKPTVLRSGAGKAGPVIPQACGWIQRRPRDKLRAMRAFRGGLFLVFLGACGGHAGAPKGPAAKLPFKVGDRVSISDGGQIYDALNTTGCVKWPNADVKKRAGRE